MKRATTQRQNRLAVMFRITRLARLARLALLAMMLVPASGWAHGLAPSLLELQEHSGGRVDVRFKEPLLLAAEGNLYPVLPASCSSVDLPTTTREEMSVESSWTLDCGQVGLAGQVIAFEGLNESGTDVLLRTRLASGSMVREVLSARSPSVRLPERETPWRVFRSYLSIGVEHILFGFDHLLFVLGLLLLLPSPRRLLPAVTAFTLGHSVTLSLVALDLVQVPSAPVEILIAVSILLLALELASPEGEGSGGLIRRFPWAVTATFGLLHGMGFAGALTEVGLPRAEIPSALLAFNLGIEMGQILFVVVILLLLGLFRNALARMPAWCSQVPVYAMGGLAAFWTLDRVVSSFS